MLKTCSPFGSLEFGYTPDIEQLHGPRPVTTPGVSLQRTSLWSHSHLLSRCLAGRVKHIWKPSHWERSLEAVSGFPGTSPRVHFPLLSLLCTHLT